MLQGQVLVLESTAVDGHASGTIALGDISSLSHETSDDSVENVVFVGELALVLPAADLLEVFGGLRAVVVV
jgi:hypothetical protein